MRLLLIFFLLIGCEQAPVEQTAGPVQSTGYPLVSGRVVGVRDGDTITVYTPDQPEMKVRLAEIDAPELGQPFGQNSKRMLSDMVFSRNIVISVQDIDRYGRHVGRIHLGDRDINAEMIRQGGAWVYTDYSNDASLPSLQLEAIGAERGLWAPSFAQSRVEPWNYRRGRRSAANDNTPPARSTAPLGCSLTRCNQMTTCAQAQHALTVCGANIDGDRDGIPCEALCSR